MPKTIQISRYVFHFDRESRVSKQRRCPICEHDGWCVFSECRQAVICGRCPSDRPVGRSGAGWLHRLDWAGPPPVWRRPARRKPTATEKPDWTREHRLCRGAYVSGGAPALHETLGVSADSLARVGVGWYAAWECWTFPMFDSKRHVIGLRTRHAVDHRKRSLTNSQSGVFWPLGLDPADPLWICEGPTNCAALLTLGVQAIGRSHNTGSMDLLTPILHAWKSRDIIIVPDRDHPGSDAAELTTIGLTALIGAALRARKYVKVVRPPGRKDIRESLQRGLTPATLLAVADAMPYRKG